MCIFSQQFSDFYNIQVHLVLPQLPLVFTLKNPLIIEEKNCFVLIEGLSEDLFS